ncbi:MAG: hypothetical protein M5R36_23445 [Deltaproteobacteria bacterium]|nr:hypothetical protein [Deltaproteobacteria bacterium]
MKRWFAVVAVAAASAGAYLALRELVLRGLLNAAADAAPLYAAALAGSLACAFVALGTADIMSRLSWLAAFGVFQAAAACAGALREPGHGLAAAGFFLAAHGAAVVAALAAARREGRAWRFVGFLALASVAGLPATPGFFARVDVLSALLHAELPMLALWSAAAQILAAAASLKSIFSHEKFEARADRADGTALAPEVSFT